MKETGVSVNIKLEKIEEEGKDFDYFVELARKFNEEQQNEK